MPFLPKRREFVFASMTVALALVAALAARRAINPSTLPAQDGAPVLVELFTSEGCSSCPPADRLLMAYHERGGPEGIPLLVMSEHVDYWDRLGWRDPFSSRRFTERQRAYARTLGVDVYTPQMIVDGRVAVVGSDSAAVAAAIQDAWRRPKVPVEVRARFGPASRRILIELTADASSASAGVEMTVAIVEDGLTSEVTRGENAGRQLTHASVVRALDRVDRWNADAGRTAIARDLDGDWNTAGLRVIALLQERGSGSVLGAASATIGPYDDRHTDRR